MVLLNGQREYRDIDYKIIENDLEAKLELNECEIELFNMIRDCNDGDEEQIQKFKLLLNHNKIRKDILNEDGDSLLFKSIKLEKMKFIDCLIENELSI